MDKVQETVAIMAAVIYAQRQGSYRRERKDTLMARAVEDAIRLAALTTEKVPNK